MKISWYNDNKSSESSDLIEEKDEPRLLRIECDFANDRDDTIF